MMFIMMEIFTVIHTNDNDVGHDSTNEIIENKESENKGKFSLMIVYAVT